jgi:GTP-binding protein HflX
VVVGEARKLVLPEPKQLRSSPERLCGLRYIHTHLDDEPLGQEDLAELALSRLDCVAAINVDSQGLPRTVRLANLVPKGGAGKPWQIWEPLSVSALSRHPFSETIRAIEKELSRGPSAAVRSRTPSDGQKVLLVGVCTGSLAEAEESMKELESLALSSGAVVVESVLQRRPAVHPQFVVGAGKIQDLAIQALQAGADTIVFDRDLTAAQVRHVTDLTDLKILDRTQLILHIFAQRAKTRDGKLQVELAQLRYRLPGSSIGTPASRGLLAASAAWAPARRNSRSTDAGSGSGSIGWKKRSNAFGRKEGSAARSDPGAVCPSCASSDTRTPENPRC